MQSRLVVSAALCSGCVLLSVASSERLEKISAYAWGAGQLGQLGIGSQRDVYTPALVSFFRDRNLNPVQCKAFADRSGFLTDDGQLFLTGTGFTSDEMYRATPHKINFPGNVKVKEFAMGSNHAAAISTQGRIYVWGNGYSGQLGLSELPKGKSLSDPEELNFGSGKFTKIACGNQISAAVDSQGIVWTFGKGRDGALAHDSTANQREPRAVAFFRDSGIKIDDVKCGLDFIIYKTSDGVLYSSGSIVFGQL